MSKWQRTMRNIHKQYGKNIKAFEKMNIDVPDYTINLFKKHGLDVNSRLPMLSIMHKRWGNGRKEEDRIDSYEKLRKVALNEN